MASLGQATQSSGEQARCHAERPPSPRVPGGAASLPPHARRGRPDTPGVEASLRYTSPPTDRHRRRGPEGLQTLHDPVREPIPFEDIDRLRSREETFRELFEHHPHPMWVFAADDLRFLEVNQAA